MSLRLQYPNAGISINDTLEEATQKAEKVQKTPDIIGSADTGYFQWNPKSGKWETTGVGGRPASQPYEQTGVTLQRILDGGGSINDLTPAAKTEVLDNAYEMGLFSDNVPEWFSEQAKQAQSESMYIQDPNNPYASIPNPNYNKPISDKDIKSLWDEYRSPITNPTSGTKLISIDGAIDEFLEEVE